MVNQQYRVVTPGIFPHAQFVVVHVFICDVSRWRRGAMMRWKAVVTGLGLIAAPLIRSLCMPQIVSVLNYIDGVSGVNHSLASCELPLLLYFAI